MLRPKSMNTPMARAFFRHYEHKHQVMKQYLDANQTTEPEPPQIPMTVPTLGMWFDAADTSTITHASGAVSSWADKSGTGITTSPLGANRPTTGTRTVNGLNTLDVTGNDDGFAFSSGSFNVGNGNSTAFLVFQSDSTVAVRLINGQNNSTGRYVIGFTGPTGMDVRASSGSQTLTQTITWNTNPNICGFVLSGTTLRGHFAGTRSSNSGAMTAGLTMTSFRFGPAAGATTGADGRLCEILIYKSALSAADTNIIGTYLSQKWGAVWSPGF